MELKLGLSIPHLRPGHQEPGPGSNLMEADAAREKTVKKGTESLCNYYLLDYGIVCISYVT